MKVFRRKVGSTFKRMVLVDESLFKQMKAALTPALTPAQVLRKRLEDQALASLTAKGTDTKDKLAMYHTLRARLGQLGVADPPRTGPPDKHDEPDQNVDVHHGIEDKSPDGQEDALDEYGDDDDAPAFEDAAETLEAKPAPVASQPVLVTKVDEKPKPDVATSSIPSQYAAKYRALKKLLDRSHEFEVDDHGRVVISSETVPGSNFEKIMRSFFVRSNEGEHDNPGRREVLKKMAELHIPDSFVSVSSAKTLMHRGTPHSTPKKQGGKGHEAASAHYPPGHRPKLLYMYRV